MVSFEHDMDQPAQPLARSAASLYMPPFVSLSSSNPPATNIPPFAHPQLATIPAVLLATTSKRELRQNTLRCVEPGLNKTSFFALVRWTCGLSIAGALVTGSLTGRAGYRLDSTDLTEEVL